mgnify:CR=1 FL=1
MVFLAGRFGTLGFRFTPAAEFHAGGPVGTGELGALFSAVYVAGSGFTCSFFLSSPGCFATAFHTAVPGRSRKGAATVFAGILRANRIAGIALMTFFGRGVCKDKKR